MASATSISSLLLSELQSLCTEARRKHPDVKEAAERVIVILRGIKATASAEIAAELAKSDEVIRPFVLACRSGNSRLTAVAVHCLQQLVSRQAISTGSVRETLSTLNTVAGQGVDIQVKVLQMVLPLVTIYDGSVSGETLVEAFALCLTLQRSRDAIVSNTAAAILRQAVVAVFDRVVAEDRELGSGSADDVSETTSEQDMTRRRAKDAFFVLQDLCLLAGDGDPIFIRTDHSVDKRLVLELLESVLANHAGVVARHPAMAQVLRERLAPFIVNFFAERASFALAVRCIRIVWLFVRDLHGDLKPECEIFLSILARLVDSGGDYPQFYRVLALEVARDTLENAVLLHRLYLQYDGRMAAVGTASAEQPGGAGAREEDCHVILDLITAVCRVVSERPAPGGDGGAGLIGADSCRMRMELSKLLDKQEAPGVPDAYVFYLAAASVLSFVEGLAGHVLPQCTESVGCRFRHSRHARASQRQVEATVAVLGVSPPLSEPGAAGALVLAAWPAMQAALGFIAGAQLDEPLFARMVGSTRQLAQAAGALGLADARDVLLAQLCRGSLPAAEAPLHLVHARQVQCLRATIACAQYLASVLGPTWYLLLVTVQQVEEVLYQSRGRAPTAAATGTAAAARRGSLSAAATPVMGGSSGDDVAGSSQASDLAAVREDFARLLAAVRASTAGSSDAVMWVVRGLCLLGSDLGGAPMDHDQEITTAMRRRLEALLPEAAPERRVSVANDRPTFATEELRAFAVENVDLLMGAAGGSGGADEGVGAQAWAAIVDCLLTSATSAQAAAGQRTQACEAVADVVLAAMALVTQQPGGGEGSSGGDFAALVASGEAQVRILRPLAQMMAQSGAQAQAGEVRKLTLDTLHRLLQASGHSLTRAWGVVFDIIQGVLRESSAMEAGRHQQQEAELLARGVFPCLQLICTDYLADLPADCLRRCIEALLVQFASQRQDLNIALTAIGQAWALCDFFHGFPQPEEAEECGDAGEDFGSSGADAAAEAWWSEPLVGGVARRRTQRVLWLLLLHSLARLGRDARHEVRLGGIQTLFRALDMHGGSFDGAVWDGVVWGVVLPLAQYVLSQRAHVFSLLRQGRVDELLQRADRGPGGDAAGDTRASGMVAEDPQRLLRAQWDETAAAALLGVTRTWGAAGGSGSGSGGGGGGGAWRVGQAELAWRRVWALTQGLFVGGTCAGDDVGAGSAALRSSASVAAGLACARVLVAQSSNSDYSARASWAAWLAMGLSVTDASSSEGACDDDDSSDAVSQDVLCDLLELGPALVAGLAKQQAFGDSDSEALLALVRRLVAYDGAPLHASDATEMSRLQRLALGSIDLIAGSGDDGSSAALVVNELAMLAALPYALAQRRGDGDLGFVGGMLGTVQAAARAFLGDERLPQPAATGSARPRLARRVVAPSYGALGHAALDRLGSELCDGAALGSARSAARVLAAGGWRCAIAALGLHAVHPLPGRDSAAATAWLVRAVPAGMQRLQASAGPALDDAWLAVGAVLAAGLRMPDDAVARAQTIDQGPLGDQGDREQSADQALAVLDAVAECSLRCAASCPAAFWHVLLDAAEWGAAADRRLAAASFGWLERLSSSVDQQIGSPPDQGALPAWVGEAAAQRLVQRSRAVVDSYVRDRALAGRRRPLAAARCELLRSVLGGLARLQCREGALASVRGGAAAHIVAVFDSLVGLVAAAADDSATALALQRCLRRVSAEALG